MHAKSANFGKICFLCIPKGVKNAVGEYISRISCPEGPLFPSGALKSCTMGKFCHSFVIPPSARRGGWRTTIVVILGYRSVAVPFMWRRKRCGSQPQVQAHGAHPETQARGRVLPVGKPCINPQARAPWGPPGCKLMGPTWRRKRCGRPSWGANVVVRSLCGNARAATKATGRGRPLRTRRRLRGR